MGLEEAGHGGGEVGRGAGGARLPWLSVGFGPTLCSSTENGLICFRISYAVMTPKTLTEKLVWLLPSSPRLDSGQKLVLGCTLGPRPLVPTGDPALCAAPEAAAAA